MLQVQTYTAVAASVPNNVHSGRSNNQYRSSKFRHTDG